MPNLAIGLPPLSRGYGFLGYFNVHVTGSSCYHGTAALLAGLGPFLGPSHTLTTSKSLQAGQLNITYKA